MCVAHMHVSIAVHRLPFDRYLHIVCNIYIAVRPEHDCAVEPLQVYRIVMLLTVHD